MCEKKDVKEYFFLRNPDEPFIIKIFGVDVSRVLDEEWEAQKTNWSQYTVVAVEREDGPGGKKLFAEQYMLWPVPVIDKFKMESRKWNCELIISARNVNSQVFDYVSLMYIKQKFVAWMVFHLYFYI